MREAKNKNWTRFAGYLFRYRGLLLVVVVLGFIALPLSLINPYLSKLIIDRAYGEKDLGLFFILLFASGGILVFNAFLSAFSGFLSQRLRRRVRFDMMLDFFRHLQTLPMGFFHDSSTGAHIFRITSDIDQVSHFICHIVPRALELFPRCLLILGMIFYIDGKIALLAVLTFPVAYLNVRVFAKHLKEFNRKFIQRSEDVYMRLQEIFSRLQLIKSFGAERHEAARLQENLQRVMDAEDSTEKLSRARGLCGFVFNRGLAGVIVLYGGTQVIKGHMTLGSLTAVMIYALQLVGLAESMGNLFEDIAVNAVPQQRLLDFWDRQPEILDKKDARERCGMRGEVVFRDVSFAYDGKKPVFSHINFSIAPGAKMALVGPSGCGKTTLVSLLVRMYDPCEGAVLIDGVDARDLRLSFLREGIGIALQEPFLWNDTVRNNILYARQGASMEDCVEAARIAQAHDFILDLPAGYDTVIGEDACKISEGQKQRIAIARALVKRPKILILDEAMSSVDPETEDKIIDGIMKFFADPTVIVVSHRPSTIEKLGSVYSFVCETQC